MDHLLHLDEHDRYLRFGSHVSEEQLARYVASIDFKRDEVFGIFNRKLQLVAVAHLAAMPGKGPHGDSSRGRAMEFGVSVLKKARGRGYGSRLFDRAVMHARNEGVELMFIHALSENTTMLQMCQELGFHVSDDPLERGVKVVALPLAEVPAEAMA